MSTRITFRVHGTPAPQGSKRHVGNGVMVESSKKVLPWRQDVKYAAIEAHKKCGSDGVHFDRGTPVAIAVTFYLARPRGHYGTGRNSEALKASAPPHPAVKPDADKLVRSTLDALGEAGIWADDSQVVHIDAMKAYADGVTPGALIEVWTP